MKLALANRALRTISECNRALVHATGEAELLDAICRIIVKLGGYRMAWVGFAEQDEAKSVRPVAQAGFDEGYLDTVNITWADTVRGQGPIGTAIRTGRLVIARNIPTDPAYAPWCAAAIQRGYASSIALPLVADGQTLGGLSIYSATPDAFDATETALLSDLADDLAYGLSALRTLQARKQNEMALHENEQRLQLAMSAANQAWFEVNVQTGEAKASPEFPPMIGLTTEEFHPSMQYWMDNLHPDDRDAVMAAFQSCIASGNMTSMEYRRRTKGGEWKWIGSVGKIVEWDASGKALRMVGIHADITERKRTESLLIGQKQVLEQIAVGASIEAALTSLLRLVESQAPRMLGSILLLDEDGVHVRHCAAPSLPREYLAAIDGQPIGPCAGSCGTAAYRKEPVVVEDIATDPLWVAYKTVALAHRLRACWSTPIFDAEHRVLGTFAIYYRQPGQPQPLHYQLIDVTTHTAAIAIVRHRTEAKLRESEERLRLALDAAHMGTFDWDVPGNRITWSRWHEELWGYTPGKFGGTYEAFEQRIHPQDLPGINAEVARCLAARAPFVREFRVVWPDGSVHWVVGQGEFTFGTDGRPQRMRGAVMEITARKQAEREVHRLNEDLQRHTAELERRVVERTADLAVAKERAETADRIKSTFLATMSHELRTPLNSVIGFTGILLQGLAGPLNAEQTKQLEMVRRSARHLLALINDLLDISKIEAGQLEVHHVPFDMPASIEKVAGLVRPQAEKQGLALHVEMAPEIGRVVSDQQRIEQVLLNLLNNAIKFTEKGSVTLTVRLTAAQSAKRSPQIEFSVTDTGVGIKPKDQTTLFQPFRQIDSGLSRNREGTGLGLAISRRLAELMGGEIRFVSAWGKGSTFTFSLPLKQKLTATKVTKVVKK